MEKTDIKLSTGEIVDIGVKEKENLKKSIEEKNPKKIAISTVEALMSSDMLMKKLTEGTFNILNQIRKNKDFKNYEDLINCDVCNEIAECGDNEGVLQFSCKKCGWWINR